MNGDREVDIGSCLRCVLEDDVLEAPDATTLVLREPANDMRFEVTGVDESVLAIRLGRRCHPSILRDGRWKSICDYLLLVPDGRRWWAVFIEMKKTLGADPHPREQLRRSLPFLRYLLSVCAIECGDPPAFHERYLLVGERDAERFDKQRVRIDPAAGPKRECHRGIAIDRFVGSALPASVLTR